jgi:hypothetical protein
VWAANQEPGAEGALQEFIAQDEIYKVSGWCNEMRSTGCGMR